jgi:hypothetical protein
LKSVPVLPALNDGVSRRNIYEIAKIDQQIVHRAPHQPLPDSGGYAVRGYCQHHASSVVLIGHATPDDVAVRGGGGEEM